jgi:fermentation-respiration switch protein FrsA (DUF1100 family)
MHALTRIGVFFGVLLVALFAFAQLIRRTGMFFPEKFPSGDWSTASLPVVPLDQTFTTPDGVTLHAWLFRAASPAARLLIWYHGNGGNITERAPIAAELARRGVSVLLFDWRGYGRSGGTPSESALYVDALAAYDFAASRLGATAHDIVLYGESIGGPYAAYTASRRGARSVVIENSLPSLRALGNALYPIPLGWFAPFAMRTTKWLNDARVPVLVMHGRRDTVIPFRLGQQLYDGIRGPKQFFVSERAGHGEIPFVEGVRYYETVVHFVG